MNNLSVNDKLNENVAKCEIFNKDLGLIEGDIMNLVIMQNWSSIIFALIILVLLITAAS